MRINFVTFHSFPFTSKQALEKIKELTDILSIYTGKTRLYSMNILKIQEAINTKTKKELATILTRRAMMRLAERLSETMNYHALITGCFGANITHESSNGSIDFSYVPISFAISIISVLSIPIRGLNTGSLSIEAFVQVRPPIV